jgi:hypothetical protein
MASARLARTGKALLEIIGQRGEITHQYRVGQNAGVH